MTPHDNVEPVVLRLIRLLFLFVHGALASVTGLLVGLARPFNPDNSRICARIYALPGLKIVGMRSVFTPSDVAKLTHHARPAVIVANHISNYDLFVFGQILCPRTVSLGKKSLKWIPLFGQLYWLAGNILVDRGNAAQAKKAMTTTTDTLQHKDMSLWVFAEGTRGHGKGLQPFKKGAFLMAINAGVPIIPVCANNYTRGMNLNRWQSTTVALRALDPIDTAGLTADDVPKLMALCHERMSACIDALDHQAGTALTSR